MAAKSTNSSPITPKIPDQAARNSLYAGGVAGLVSITCTHPLERVKMMRIFGTKEIANMNILRSIYTIGRTKGVTSLLRGNSASCIREFPNAALMFYFYETFKNYSLKHKKPDESDLIYRVMSGA